MQYSFCLLQANDFVGVVGFLEKPKVAGMHAVAICDDLAVVAAERPTITVPQPRAPSLHSPSFANTPDVCCDLLNIHNIAEGMLFSFVMHEQQLPMVKFT
jgi:hypothetical protein